MASRFSNRRSQCEGEGCLATTEVTYYVEEKKKLCCNCASKTEGVRKERKGELNWFCEKHNKRVTIYCKTHNVSVCHLCATIGHKQQSCVLQDLEDAITEKKQQLLDLKATTRDRMAIWKEIADKIGVCKDTALKHLNLVRDQVDSLIDDEIKKMKDRTQREAALINKEADDEIRRINEKREKRLKQCNENADKQLKPIEDKRRELHNDVTMIYETARTKLSKLQKQRKDLMIATVETAQRLDSLLHNKRELIIGANEMIKSLTVTLENSDEPGAAEHITRSVQGLRLIKGMGNKKYDGRIGGYEGNWELTQGKGLLAEIVDNPCIVGCIGDTVIFRSYVPKHTFMLDFTDETVRMIVTSDGDSSVRSCAPLTEKIIVCGMRRNLQTKKFIDDAIRLYDRQWNLIKRISLPNNLNESGHTYTGVDVFTANDGKIVAAAAGQNNIYIINPADGKIVHTIKCKYNIALRGTLKSGDIICHRVWPLGKLVLIISREGVQREITLEKEIKELATDPVTDDIYVILAEEGQEKFHIDRMSSKGVVKRRKLLEYTPRNEYAKYSRLIMTTSGKLILSDGRDCLVFKNRISF